ncbi:hypothetical protein N0V93_010085 [Gnomoniopsis smithogilvyi]|uniref:Rhodopsin domain-containing protein n=1 Tax=Gnomoniopsis smithogilvyi TaxID=1191159 RepID=A0A9W8YJD3_9PEZI|nr:hypothetical protein N0V93_010085 [Gnomoniopsis smithogilvyi]
MTIYEDDAPHVIGAVVTLMLLAFTTFGLRVYVRYGPTWGFEDTVMAGAVLPFTVLSISCILAGLNGVGVHAKHLAEPGNEQYETKGLMYFFLFEVFYCGTIIPIKLSIALMLIRIAQNRKGYVWSQWAMMTLFFVVDGGAMFYIIFQCKPVSYAWNTDQEGYCLPATWLADIYYVTTAVNIATDWVTALLPIPLLWHVRLERSEKISVGGILGLGIFASLAACIRLNYTINLTDESDYLFSVSNIVIWGYGEIAVGMFVGCLATLRPLFRKMFRLGSLGSSKSRGGTGASPFPSHARRAYGQHSRLRDDIEMGGMGTTSNAFKGSVSVSHEVTGGTRTSVTSESDSMEQILKEAKKQGVGGSKGIMVSRQVQIAHSPSPN